MRAAGIRQLGGAIEALELPPPRALRAGEVLLDVHAAGVGNWDEFVRTGGWDTGARPPMALGVEAAGVVTAVGGPGTGLAVGDRVTRLLAGAGPGLQAGGSRCPDGGVSCHGGET